MLLMKSLKMELFFFFTVISSVQLVFKGGSRQEDTAEAFNFCVEIKEQQTPD